MNKKEANKIKREQLIAYKGGRCMDCNRVFPIVCMDFDHRIPAEKSFAIGSNYNKSIDDLMLEVDKCDLVCSNCHRIRTADNPLVKAKMSASQMGRTAWNKGKQLPPFSAEWRANMAEAKIGNKNKLGNKNSAETIAKRIASIMEYHRKRKLKDGYRPAGWIEI